MQAAGLEPASPCRQKHLSPLTPPYRRRGRCHACCILSLLLTLCGLAHRHNLGVRIFALRCGCASFSTMSMISFLWAGRVSAAPRSVPRYPKPKYLFPRVERSSVGSPPSALDEASVLVPAQRGAVYPKHRGHFVDAVSPFRVDVRFRAVHLRQC